MTDVEQGERTFTQKVGLLAIALITVSLVVASLFVKTGTFRMLPGETFDLSESTVLTEPFDLSDSEGSWNVLTIEAQEVSVAEEYWLNMTGRTGQMFQAANEHGVTQSDVDQAVAARQISLNVASGGRMLIITESDMGIGATGSRILATGEPLVEGLQQAGEWLIVTPEGDYATLTVSEGASVTAAWQDVRPHESPEEPLETGVDAVSADPFGLTQVAGSSSGLAMTLAWADILTTDDLTGGLDVAATGTIHSDGKVGPVSGVEQKLESAAEEGFDLVLVPEGYEGEVPDGLEVVEVSTFDEAQSVVREYAESAR